jgi:hypothetical protein
MVVFWNNGQYDNDNRLNAIIIKRNGCRTVQIAIKVRLYVTMAQSTRLLPFDSMALKSKISTAVNTVGWILQFICRNGTDDGDPDTLFVFLFITVINCYGLRSPFALRHSHRLLNGETWLIVSRLHGMKTVTRDYYKQQSAFPSTNLLLGFCMSRDKAKNTREIKSTSPAEQIHTQMLPTHLQTSTSIQVILCYQYTRHKPIFFS